MADALDADEKLFARAAAAIAAAERLCAQNLVWRTEISVRLKRMHARASFQPKSQKLLSPLDFPEKPRSYRPFPGKYDD
ncbi:hypothetical protein [Bradyrhizobium arachidis]|uniref:hypothetical protein n=1 Tax=Bradyrhizobium arachidis TaxID=858423 RepID=UPI001160BBC1|nr:hypothetical protein [Bradyrhizobium arachidis]